jgi:hypothetical protein
LLTAGAPEGSTTNWVAGGLLLLILVVTLVVLALNLAGRDPDAELRARLAFGDDPASLALLTRWLRRSRHFRYVGGVAGAILGVGFTANGGLGPIVVGALAGVTAGGALAEARFRRPRPAAIRVVELTRRRVRDYAHPFDLAALALIGTVAVGLATWSFLGLRGSPGPVPATAAAVVVAAVALGQRLVAVRPRPALHPGLREADEVMRRLAASQGFARPGIALAVVLLAVAANGAGAEALSAALWLVGLGLYWSSRQREKSLRAALR